MLFVNIAGLTDTVRGMQKCQLLDPGADSPNYVVTFCFPLNIPSNEAGCARMKL